MTTYSARSRRAVAKQVLDLLSDAQDLLLDLETMETNRYERLVEKRSIDAPSCDKVLVLLDVLDDLWTDLDDTKSALRTEYRLKDEGGEA
jgi:hypothetical protein